MSFLDLWDSIKITKIHKMEVAQGEEWEKEAENI